MAYLSNDSLLPLTDGRGHQAPTIRQLFFIYNAKSLFALVSTALLRGLLCAGLAGHDVDGRM